MKHLILGKGRFSGISSFVVKNSAKKPSRIVDGKFGGGEDGRGGYVKKNLYLEDGGKGGEGIIKKKLKPLKFKM